MNANILNVKWGQYKKYVRSVLLPGAHTDTRDLSYWRDEVFCTLMVYTVPVSIIALVPGVYMALRNGTLLMALTDLLAFLFMVLIIIKRDIAIWHRKLIFLCTGYSLPIVLLYYLGMAGPGLMYLLALSILACVIYSYSAAYYTVLASSVICFFIGVLIHLGHIHIATVNEADTWAAISSNVVFLSLISIESLKLLMKGMEDTMNDKLAIEKEKELLTNRLLLATKSAGMGIWEWDIRTNHIQWDKGMSLLYRVDYTKYGSAYDAWLSRLHPEDKHGTNQKIKMAVAGTEAYDTEFRIVWDDQSIRYIRATGAVERDGAGVAVRMIGANWDVTAVRMQQEKLALSEANLKAIIESADASIYSLDTDFRYITFNDELRKSVKRAYNIDVNQGDIVFEFLERSSPQEALEWRRIYTEALTGKPLKFEKEFNTDDNLSTTSFSVNPIYKNSSVVGLACFALDITEIRKAHREIQKLNEGLEVIVAERTAELKNANDELEAFSYSVSHDLRAPVRAIMGFTKIIKNDYSNTLTEDVKEMFGYIENSSHRMNNIIEDLFVLAKYGKEKLIYSDVDLSVLFSQVWDNLLFTSPHHATLEMGEMPVVYADRSMLQQVIVNLISNAIKYSSKKENPKVTVGYYRTDTSVTIHVKDNGAGFDMQYYDRLFGAFQRLHGENEFEGTGVGLMLTKKIIDKHGGAVWAEAKVGEGATFYFSLPLAI